MQSICNKIGAQDEHVYDDQLHKRIIHQNKRRFFAFTTSIRDFAMEGRCSAVKSLWQCCVLLLLAVILFSSHELYQHLYNELRCCVSKQTAVIVCYDPLLLLLADVATPRHNNVIVFSCSRREATSLITTVSIRYVIVLMLQT